MESWHTVIIAVFNLKIVDVIAVKLNFKTIDCRNVTFSEVVTLWITEIIYIHKDFRTYKTI